MINSAPSLKVKAAAELELRRRKPPVLRYANDPVAFICNEVWIDNAQSESNEPAIRFNLWAAQRDLLADMLHERLLLILKARQLGISWLVCAYALWLCLHRPSRLVLFFSIGQGEANEMMRRVTAMYWRIRSDLRKELPSPLKENTEELRFDNGSAVQSLPSRKTAGSGYTASLIVLDEFAKNENAQALYTAVKPTIDGGGSMIVLSSAHGVGNLFFELVEKARRGIGRFVFRFLSWQARPDRDAAWYAGVAADAVDSGLMKQEYPETADEAFEATEVDAFLRHVSLWNSCKETFDAIGQREPLILSLDAGETDDTFAIVPVTRHPSDPKRVALREARVFYPGPDGVNFVEVYDWLVRFCRTHNVIQVCYDRYQLRLMMQRLEQEEGVWCEEFKQTGPRLESDKFFRDAIFMKSVAHDGDEVLAEHVMNANAKVEGDGRIRIVKRVHHKKIDAAVASAMGVHRFLTEFISL